MESRIPPPRPVRRLLDLPRPVLGWAPDPMEPQEPTPRVVRFGVFELDRRSGELRKDGVRVRAAGAAPAGPRRPAGRARGARHARGLAPAAVARRDVRGLRQRAQPRHQPPARGAGRRGGQPAVHRDAGAPRLPLHRAGRRCRTRRRRRRRPCPSPPAPASRRRGRDPAAVGRRGSRGAAGRRGVLALLIAFTPALRRDADPRDRAPHPFTGGPAPGQPDRRPRAGILQRRDDRRAHHEPRVPAGPARDLPAVGHALQGQRQAPAGDRAGAGRGGRGGGLGRPLGRAGAHHRPARPRPHRSPSLGPQLRTPAGGRARAAGRAVARDRRGGPHHASARRRAGGSRPSAR